MDKKIYGIYKKKDNVKKKISMYDVCGTIYYSNTTFDFLDFFLKESKEYKKILLKRNKLIFKISNKLLLTFFKYDLLKKISIKCLEGYSKDELRLSANKFYDLVLKNKINKKILNQINKDKKNNCRIILFSASLDFLVEVISEKLAVEEFISTELDYVNGISSGKIKNDILFKKLQIYNNILYNSKDEVKFYSDNISDIKLLSKVDYPNIIINKKNQKYMKKIKFTYKKWD